VNTVGRRRVGAPAVPAPVERAYTARLQRPVLTLAEQPEPLQLRLDQAADRRVLDLERILEPRLAPHAELAHISDWAAKLTGATAHLAGLIHLAETLPTVRTRPLDPRHVDAATRLGQYFLAHALAVFDRMGADPELDDARHVLDWIVRSGRTSFPRRDAFSALSRLRFRKVADLEPALHTLADHGYLRQTPVEVRQGGAGRPSSPRWEVHPASAQSTESAKP
jgi:hypothetical protein